MKLSDRIELVLVDRIGIFGFSKILDASTEKKSLSNIRATVEVGISEMILDEKKVPTNEVFDMLDKNLDGAEFFQLYVKVDAHVEKLIAKSKAEKKPSKRSTKKK